MSKTFLGTIGFFSFLLAASTFACGSDSSGTSPGTDGGPTTDGGGAPDGDTIDPATCPTLGSGTVTITATGLPAGVNAKVSAKNSSGTATEVQSGATLPGGVYTVTALTATSTDPIVRAVYKPTLTSQASVCSKDGAGLTITVSYELVASSNKLWGLAANSTNQLLGFSSSSIQATSNADAPVGVPLTNPNGIAYDKDGGLWTADGDQPNTKLVHIPASQLGAGGAKTPDIMISSAAINSGSFPGVSGMAFDKSGNLWVTKGGDNQVLRFDAAKLAATGTVEPTVKLGDVAHTALEVPSALAFDTDGNLWVSDNGNNRVVRYDAAHLSASTVQADVKITLNGFSGDRGIAFDSAKNLWAVFDRVLVKITPAQQGTTNAIDPAIHVAIDPLGTPEQIAFDESGGVWFAWKAGTLGHLPASMLTTSTAAGENRTPDIVITSSALGSGGIVGTATDLAFYPAPAGTPMFSALP